MSSSLACLASLECSPHQQHPRLASPRLRPKRNPDTYFAHPPTPANWLIRKLQAARAMAAPPPNTAFPPPTHASTAAAAGRPFEIDDEPSSPTAAMPDVPPPPVPPVADGADPSAAANNGDALMGGVSVGGDGGNGGKAVMGAGAVQVSVQWCIVEGSRMATYYVLLIFCH